ncbi:MAG: hypothetical protein ACOC1K_04845 [Nanoarchaeota archaeon]
MIKKNKIEKIDEITNFILTHPESTASMAILERHQINNNYFETANELSLNLKKKLKNENTDEIDFCYYLIK